MYRPLPVLKLRNPFSSLVTVINEKFPCCSNMYNFFNEESSLPVCYCVWLDKYFQTFRRIVVTALKAYPEYKGFAISGNDGNSN